MYRKKHNFVLIVDDFLTFEDCSNGSSESFVDLVVK